MPQANGPEKGTFEQITQGLPDLEVVGKQIILGNETGIRDGVPVGAEQLTVIELGDFASDDMGRVACLQGDGSSVDDTTQFVYD